jgi:2-haloacid dehalogenase
MSSSVGRREFLVAASSLGGAAVLAGGLTGVARAGEPGYAFAPQNPPAAQTQRPATGRPRALAFDVNQTLLDTEALRPSFQQAFGDGAVLDEWFALLLQYSLVVTVADSYADFGTVGRAALEMVAKAKGMQLAPAEQTRILQGVLTLPPHPEVPAALESLRAAGFRMVTLTNSSSTAVAAQMQNSGLGKYFEESISVDTVRLFKPDLEVYRRTALHLGVAPGELMMVAAHAWDVMGALKAGWRAAFVARPGKVLFPLAPVPEIVAPDIKGVADALLRLSAA